MSDAVAATLATLVNAKRLFIQTGYCPNCLKGGTSTAEAIPSSGGAQFWRGLLAANKIDVYQALHMYVPGKNSISRFKESLKSPFEPGTPCSDGTQCGITCFFCHYMIEEDDHIRMRVGDHAFFVHTSCLGQCSHIPNGKTKRDRCQNHVPIVPRYAKMAGFETNYCKTHSQSAACNAACELKKDEFFTAVTPRDPNRYPAPQARAQKQDPSQPPPPGAPIRRPPKQQRPTKLERESERGRSKDIKAMLGAKQTEEFKRPAQAVAVAQAYERPVVVFTPHAHIKPAGKSKHGKKFNFDP